jgi:hypothetical protein
LALKDHLRVTKTLSLDPLISICSSEGYAGALSTRGLYSGVAEIRTLIFIVKKNTR